MNGDAEESSKKENDNIDITYPYFLTTTDHLGQNFVGESLLCDGNYSDRKNEMTNALLAKNNFGFIDGSMPMLAEDTTDLMNWKHYNDMVYGWLISSMEREIKSNIKYAIPTRDMWVDLEERFGKENAIRAYELRHIITAIHQEGMTIST